MSTNQSVLLNDINKENPSEILFLGFDFETLTPKGRPPEPIELGVLRLRADLSKDPSYSFHEYIKPPKGVVFTSFDINQTGIRPEHVANARAASEVLSDFDKSFDFSNSVFVAQNAKYDFSIFKRFENVMPNAINRPFLDTVKIAKHIFPDAKSFNLDSLAELTGVDVPKGRHSALVDVELTLAVFAKLVQLCIEENILCISQLLEIGQITDFGKPKQTSLF